MHIEYRYNYVYIYHYRHIIIYIYVFHVFGSCYPRVSPSFVAPAIRSLTTEGCHVGNACQELLDQHVLATVVPSWVSPGQKLKLWAKIWYCNLQGRNWG